MSVDERGKLKAKIANIIESGDKMEIRVTAFRGFDKVGESWIVVNKADFKDKKGKVDNVKLMNYVKNEMKNFLKSLKGQQKTISLSSLEVTEDEL